MKSSVADSLGTYLRRARLAAQFNQSQLARAAKVPRLRVVRAESGHTILNLDEAARIAAVLKVPLQRLHSGGWRPTNDLRGIALELGQLGIRDLEVLGAQVPGAFRAAEQIVPLALQGDAPEPRVLEAIPFILARRQLTVPLTLAFADVYDPRIRTRLAWLSDVTLTLSRLSSFPVAVASETTLAAFVRAGKKSAEPDSLGHPRTDPPPPLWRRWNITYAGNLASFLERTIEVDRAYRCSGLLSGTDE